MLNRLPAPVTACWSSTLVRYRVRDRMFGQVPLWTITSTDGAREVTVASRPEE
jgi:hypothetical protein